MKIITNLWNSTQQEIKDDLNARAKLIKPLTKDENKQRKKNNQEQILNK